MAGADDQISAEEYERSLTPRQALNIVQAALEDIGVAARMIMERLKGGLVGSVAKSSSWGQGGTPTGMVGIPTKHWFYLSGETADWWDTGDVRFSYPPVNTSRIRTGRSTGRYYGVRFTRDQIEEMVRDMPRRALAASPESVLASAQATDAETRGQPPAARHPGGRSPLTFWEDALLAIAHKIYLGEFKPVRQADIQRALADWIVDNGYEEPGPTALKERAKKLWNTFGE
jgi:hypothetical protein